MAAAITARQLDDVGGQAFFVLTAPRPLALGGSMLPQRRERAPLGRLQRAADVLNTRPPAGGAQ